MPRSQTFVNDVAAALDKYRPNDHGARVDLYDCGGYEIVPSYSMKPGEVTEFSRPCTNHKRHTGTHAEEEISGTDHPDPKDYTGLDWQRYPAAQPYPGQDVIRLDLARIIATRTSLAHNPIQGAVTEITDGYYLIPRHDFPDVPANAMRSNCITVGSFTFSGTHDKDLAKMRRDAASMAAWADYLEQQDHQAQEEQRKQEERLQARRDALALELCVEVHGTEQATATRYSSVGPITQAAVDRIIVLEDELEKVTE